MSCAAAAAAAVLSLHKYNRLALFLTLETTLKDVEELQVVTKLWQSMHWNRMDSKEQNWNKQRVKKVLSKGRILRGGQIPRNRFLGIQPILIPQHTARIPRSPNGTKVPKNTLEPWIPIMLIPYRQFQDQLCIPAYPEILNISWRTAYQNQSLKIFQLHPKTLG